MAFKITWDQELSTYFKYGSKVSYLQDGGVIFENEMLYPGAEIVTWQSEVWYFSSRSVLQLPLLKRGSRYRLKFSGTVFPEQSVLLKVEFFSHASESVGLAFLNLNSDSFVYPQEAYYYKISLLSTGLSKLTFQAFELSEET